MNREHFDQALAICLAGRPLTKDEKVFVEALFGPDLLPLDLAKIPIYKVSRQFRVMVAVTIQISQEDGNVLYLTKYGRDCRLFIFDVSEYLDLFKHSDTFGTFRRIREDTREFVTIEVNNEPFVITRGTVRANSVSDNLRGLGVHVRLLMAHVPIQKELFQQVLPLLTNGGRLVLVCDHE